MKRDTCIICSSLFTSLGKRTCSPECQDKLLKHVKDIYEPKHTENEAHLEGIFGDCEDVLV